MERFHYLGDVALVGESLRYVAELDGELVALLSWGAASLRNGPRDRHVGWQDEARMANLPLVVNNSRFLILPWSRRPHLASRVLGANLRRLSRDWQQVYGHRLVLAETFVDTSRFRGTCYRAANWVWVGETKGWSKSGEEYRFNGQPKAVWLYPLTRDFKTQLCTVARTGTRKEGFMDLDVERIPLHGEGGLFEILETFPDIRKRRGIRHRIESILATALCAVLAGARSFIAIAEWSAEQSPETLMRLGSRRGKSASERTYRRVLQSIDVEEFDRRTGKWMAEQQRLQAGAGLAMDGKTVRGSADGEQRALHLLSAVVHGSGTVVAQAAVESKTNEITKVAPLLSDLEIDGTVVTADALLTQREVARHIVEEKQADYVFTVKENQPTMRKDIEELFVSECEDAERRQRAREQRSRAVFPPSAPEHREGSRKAGDT
jgi:predicted transposase YbfD/YdcC